MIKIKNLFDYAKNHKKYSIFILVIIILAIFGISKFFDSEETVTQYIFAKVTKQDVTISVSGSGQVSALDEVNITAEVSGDIDYVNVKAGDIVKKGQILAHIESTDAKRAVSNAEINLTNEQIAYEKAQKIYKNQIGQSTTTISDLDQAIDDGYTTITSVFIDLPKILNDVSDIYYDPSNSPYFSDENIRFVASEIAIDYKYEAGIILDSVKKDYESLFKIYKNLSPNSSQADVVNLTSKTREVLKKLSSALTGTYNTIEYVSDRTTGTKPTEISTDKSILSSYITKTTSYISQLSSSLTKIEEAEDSATTADINLKSAELDLNEAEDSLKTAKENLTNHTIISPFDGVISKINIEAGDKISNNGAIATVITNNKKVSISLNEVDAAKISIGDKAILTFDAIDELTMQGTVYDIDVVGTVSNGVVSYGANISFDSTDNRIKAGMTTNISIATKSANNVLAISSAAISTKNNKNYVSIPISTNNKESTTDAFSLKEIEIQTGLSGDELTEIIGGLSEGDTYVSGTKTVKNNTDSSGSLFSMFGRSSTRGSMRNTSSNSSSSGSGSSSNSRTTNNQSGSGMPMPPQ